MLIIFIMLLNLLTPIVYSAYTEDIGKYRKMAENIVRNFIVIEGYRYKRLFSGFLPSDRWIAFNQDSTTIRFSSHILKYVPPPLYSPLYPNYLIRNNTVITIPKGDSVILSLSTILFAAAMNGYSSLLDLPCEQKEMKSLLTGHSWALNEFDVKVTNDGVVFLSNSSRKSRGPPIFLEAFYWDIQNPQYRDGVLSNYEDLLKGIRNLSNYEPKVKALYFPFLIQWSIDNQSAGVIYPAVLSDTLPAAQVPYALRKDIKFTVAYQNSSQKPFKILMPSSAGSYIYYSTMDLLDPIKSLKDNTIIVAPAPNAKVGTEFTLTIYVTHTILNEVEAKYIIRFKVGDEFWTYLQGSEFAKETISNLMHRGREISVGHTCLSKRVGSCFEQNDSLRKIVAYYYHRASPPNYNLELTHYYHAIPRVNVKVLGYGPYGEAIIEVSLYAKLNNVYLLEERYFYFSGSPCSSEIEHIEWWQGPPRGLGGDRVDISADIKSGMIKYSTSVKAVLIAGGALPVGAALIPPLGQKGSWQASARSEVEHNSLGYNVRCCYDCVPRNITIKLHGKNTEVTEWYCYPREAVSMSKRVEKEKINSQVTGINIYLDPVPDVFRYLKTNSSDLNMVFIPEVEGWKICYRRSFSLPGWQLKEVRWRDPYVWEYFSAFNPVWYLRYRPSGRAEEIDILKESYVRLSVSNFYVAPGDNVSGSVEVVYGGKGAETDVDIEILVEDATYRLLSVHTNSSGIGSFTFKVPPIKFIEGLLGLNVSSDNVTEITLEVIARESKYNLSDYALIHVPLRSVIAGFLYVADLSLTYSNERITTPAVSVTFTHLNAELIDGEVNDIKHDAAATISALTGEHVNFIITATNVDNRSEVYEVNTSLSSYMLRVPEGTYEVALTVKVGDRVFKMEPEVVEVGRDSVVVHNINVPVPIIIRAEKLLEEVKDWSLRNSDVYYMMLALLKSFGNATDELSDAVDLLMQGTEEGVNSVGSSVDSAVSEILSSLYYSPPRSVGFTNSVISYLEGMRSVLKSYDPERIAKYVSTVNATLKIPEEVRTLLLLDRTDSLPKYDPDEVRRDPNNPYHKAIRLMLYLAYLRNRKRHIPNVVWTLVKLSSLQTVIWMSKNLWFFRAPFGPLKSVNPILWFRLKAFQISLLALGGLDLNLGISKSLTMSFLRKCQERYGIDPGTVITAYFKITRFALAATVGEFRKDMNFEVMFHLINMILGNVVLNSIYIPRQEKYLQVFVDEVKAGNFNGSLEDAIRNAEVMDYNTNNFESFSEGMIQIVNSVLNVGRAVSGILEIGSVAQTIFDKNYLDTGDQVYKIISYTSGNLVFHEWRKASVARFSTKLQEFFRSANLGNLVKVLKTSSTAALGLTVALAASDILLFSPKYSSATAVTILNSSIMAEKISFPEGVFKLFSSSSLSKSSKSESRGIACYFLRNYAARACLSSSSKLELGSSRLRYASTSVSGWEDALAMTQAVMRVRDSLNTGYANFSDIADVMDLLRSVKQKLIELELEAEASGKDPTQYTQYRVALEEAFEEFIDELAIYFAIPGINVKRAEEASDRLTAILRNISKLPEPTWTVTGDCYRLVTDIYPSLTKEGVYVVEITPYGNPPSEGTLTISGVNVVTNVTEVTVDLSRPIKIYVETEVIEEGIAGILKAALSVDGIVQDVSYASVIKPLLKLWSSTYGNTEVLSLVPAEIEITGNTINLKDVGTNYIVVKTGAEMNITATKGVYEVTTLRDIDGNYIYFILSVECKSVTGSPGQFTQIPIDPLTAGLVAATLIGTVAAYILKKKSLQKE